MQNSDGVRRARSPPRWPKVARSWPKGTAAPIHQICQCSIETPSIGKVWSRTSLGRKGNRQLQQLPPRATVGRSPTGRAGLPLGEQGARRRKRRRRKGRKRGWRESNCCDTGCTKALGVLQARASAATPPQRRHAQACPASKSRGARDDGEDNRGSHRGEHQITEDRGEPGTIEDRGSHRTEPHGTSLLLTLPAHLLPTRVWAVFWGRSRRQHVISSSRSFEMPTGRR
ncbi:unnamed protein product [Prorocentrum cordatum]|uniref:Uncharacterized protein n=1 Tax=Prorocentrum cordatum TaxID=2364126 RepID=A0ABN9RLR8_9DINO|nr:unnamed protein product [Polarella glacialis]